MSSLLESFRTAYRNLQLLPLLEPEEIEKFRVPYGRRVLLELEQVVDDCTPTNNKIIFTGHRGCGKSTLLGELGRLLDDRYFVVFFSIADLIEMSDVNHINILFSIAMQMMEKAEKSNAIEIEKAVIDKFHQWFATRTNTTTNNINAEVSSGFDFWGFLKGQMKVNSSVRQQTTLELKNNFPDLIARIEEIAAVIQTATNKDIIVIIDDLDKLDLSLVNEIYRNNIKALFQPKFRIIFTVPISVIREIPLRASLTAESSNQIKIMPVSKMFRKGENRLPDAEPIVENVTTFSTILNKRIPMELIEISALKEMIFQSGGVLRELIRIASLCCSECLLQLRMEPDRTDVKITPDVVKGAVNEIRNEFASSLGKPQYEMLTAIYLDFDPNYEDDNGERKFLDLLHGLYVLEYRNDDLWYDVHPIVADLLKRKGYLNVAP